MKGLRELSAASDAEEESERAEGIQEALSVGLWSLSLSSGH